jgi:hypothetical protein
MALQHITMLKEGDVSEYGYRVIYEPVAEGGYQVIVPALPGIVTYDRRGARDGERRHRLPSPGLD